MNGSDCHTTKYSLSFSIWMQLFQTRLSKFHMVLTDVRKPELEFRIANFPYSGLNNEFLVQDG
jgi:hypothetical protein